MSTLQCWQIVNFFVYLVLTRIMYNMAFYTRIMYTSSFLWGSCMPQCFIPGSIPGTCMTVCHGLLYQDHVCHGVFSQDHCMPWSFIPGSCMPWCFLPGSLYAKVFYTRIMTVIVIASFCNLSILCVSRLDLVTNSKLFRTTASSSSSHLFCLSNWQGANHWSH